jgi:RNA polymerase sigma-70 factor (ECF subfamily)
MIFACCHPDLAEPTQVALTLYAAGGLSTAEIAAAFLVPLPTMAQRLSRAKRQLRERGIRFELPQPHEYADRLPAVLAVIYLVFNEGYLSGGRSAAQRRELAREGVELARQLATLLPREPEVAGLVALLELHQARAAARFAVGPAPALDEVDALVDRLAGYHLWHAARADLLAMLDRPSEALAAAERALELATNPAERELMSRRVGELRRRL